MLSGQKLNSHRIFQRLAKALIRLHVCAGWSEPLLIVHTTLLEISCRSWLISLKQEDQVALKRSPAFCSKLIYTEGLQNAKYFLHQEHFLFFLKETRSVTMSNFRKKFFFLIICKNRIKLCFHNKYVQYS